MTINQIVDKFLAHPGYIKNGAKFLAKKWKVSAEDICKAREIVRNSKQIDFKKLDSKPAGIFEKILKPEIHDLPPRVVNPTKLLKLVPEPPKFNTERVDVEKGQKEVSKIVANAPKNANDVKVLFGVDDVTTKLTQYWIKETSGGFLVSALIKVINQDFYSNEELKEKLKELFPIENIKPVSQCEVCTEIPEIGYFKDTLVIYISDDHVGMILNNSMFGNENTEGSYTDRLLTIVDEIAELPYVFHEIIVISLGDQMNGFNQFTTRGGHIVPSLSNKEQFDSYTSARKQFYDALFTSGKSESYVLVEVNNSNHTGNGFSYMGNEYLRLYIETKYPQVRVFNTEDFIQVIDTYSEHTLFVVHGKDQSQQKNSFPYNLDHKTEVFFTDYILEKGYNPKVDFCTVIKGDLHKFNESESKTFRYVNIGSIANGSEWQEHNFGNSKPGALIEIYSEGKREPIREIIRF